VEVTLVPSGMLLGSAQAVLRWKGITAVISGDYKRRRDPTGPLFEPVSCNLFVSEASFGLPRNCRGRMRGPVNSRWGLRPASQGPVPCSNHPLPMWPIW
jgi:Cft2 family RNA processing exonuclease